MSNDQMYCPCGDIILADTEEWPIPLCYECYIQTPEGIAETRLNKPESQSANCESTTQKG